jgi:hypothetical protein
MLQFLHGVNTPQCSLNGVTFPFFHTLCLRCLWSVSPSFLLFSFFRGDHFQSATSAPSLRQARPERFPNKVSVRPGYHNHPKFSSSFSLSLSTIIRSFHLFLFSLFKHNNAKCSLSLSLSLTHPTVGDITHGVAGALTLPAPPVSAVSFFHFGGALPLHKDHFLIFRNTLEIPSAHFTISSLMAFL